MSVVFNIIDGRTKDNCRDFYDAGRNSKMRPNRASTIHLNFSTPKRRKKRVCTQGWSNFTYVRGTVRASWDGLWSIRKMRSLLKLNTVDLRTRSHENIVCLKTHGQTAGIGKTWRPFSLTVQRAILVLHNTTVRYLVLYLCNSGRAKFDLRFFSFFIISDGLTSTVLKSKRGTVLSAYVPIQFHSKNVSNDHFNGPDSTWVY